MCRSNFPSRTLRLSGRITSQETVNEYLIQSPIVIRPIPIRYGKVGVTFGNA